MDTKNRQWELTIVDGMVPSNDLSCLGAADIDGDGIMEVITGGSGGLFWYKQGDWKRHLIAEGHFHVGLALEDIDKDGFPEVFVGEETEIGSDIWMVTWYKPGDDIYKPWIRYIIEPEFEGGSHDIVFGDIDGDGENELMTIACYTKTPGIFIFKRGPDLKQPWKKYPVVEGIFTEGLSVGDINGDGKLEIICGPDWYTAPEEGPYTGKWTRRTFAPNFREMCRTGLIDISGNGRPDIVIQESEYDEGRLSWFENRVLEDNKHPWVEHIVDENLIFAHSLSIWTNEDKKAIHIFSAEMEKGGWNAPYNPDARLIEYITLNKGLNWERDILYNNEGTHQAIAFDIDRDGEQEIVGKTSGAYWHNPKVQIWKKQKGLNALNSYNHCFIDRDKPTGGSDIVASDVDGDGLKDVICASWWYKNPTWERYSLPEDYCVVNAYDIDGDGREEIIAYKMKPKGEVNSPYIHLRFSSEMYWLKPIDPVNGKWEIYPIGTGIGDWPHGTAIGPILPSGKLALILGYHSAGRDGHRPEIFEVPDDPKTYPWSKRMLADIQYGEEFAICDVDGDGKLDIVAGPYWLENLGNGEFKPYKFAQNDIVVARLGVMDINGDGRLDVVIGEEVMDFEKKVIPFSKVAWFENPEDPKAVPWKMHVIDTVRCAHSLGIGDLDGDDELEIVCGEHDPFRPYRNRCRVLVYKKADKEGNVWKSFKLDGRFEHHDGTKVFEVEPGKSGIISHGWQDDIYVNLWKI